MVIFDIVNLVLFTIFIVAVFNLYWHLRFIRKTNHFQLCLAFFNWITGVKLFTMYIGPKSFT